MINDFKNEMDEIKKYISNINNKEENSINYSNFNNEINFNKKNRRK